jgi:ATP-dependent exoDNAse (exonuclease V) alpha subunit
VTGADRARASRYQVGDVLHYQHGSKVIGIERRSYAKVIATNPNQNLLTVQKPDGAQLTYDPSKLRGIGAYREIERQFTVGDRLQFTAPNRKLGIANRHLGTIAHITNEGQLAVRMDGGKTVTVDTNEMRHFDHGYAVASLSSQKVTVERVLVNLDTSVHPELINSRFAYVSISRASHDAQIYTNNAVSLVPRLSHNATKTFTLEMGKAHDARVGISQGLGQQEANDLGAGFSL